MCSEYSCGCQSLALFDQQFGDRDASFENRGQIQESAFQMSRTILRTTTNAREMFNSNLGHGHCSVLYTVLYYDSGARQCTQTEIIEILCDRERNWYNFWHYDTSTEKVHRRLFWKSISCKKPTNGNPIRQKFRLSVKARSVNQNHKKYLTERQREKTRSRAWTWTFRTIGFHE